VRGSKASHITMKQFAAEAEAAEKMLSQTQQVKVVTSHGDVKNVNLPTPAAVKAAKKVAAEAPQQRRKADRAVEVAQVLEKRLNASELKNSVSVLREINLIDVAQQLEYQRVKGDKDKWRTPVGTINISKDGKKFMDFSASKGGGGAIDFVMHCEDVKFRDAVQILSKTTGVEDALSAATQHIVKDFKEDLEITTPKKPEKSNDINDQREMFSWLTKTRKIPVGIVTDWIDRGKVYAMKFYDRWQAVFVHNENAFLKINPSNKFRGFEPGSKTDVPMLNMPFPDKKIYVVEGHIDAMSLQAFKKNTAIAGTVSRVSSTIQYLRKNGFNDDQIIIATDNDKAGNAIAEQFSELQRVTPSQKDWNDDLIASVEQQMQNDSISHQSHQSHQDIGPDMR